MAREKRTRRRFLRAAAGTAALSVLGSRRDAAAAEQPNVLYVFSDQHRDCSMPGEPFSDIQAPNMMRLAREGVRFRNCISNYPVCSPYRATLITGKWPYHSGVIDNRIRVESDGNSVGDVFRKAGYRTGYVGKWHLQGQPGPYQEPGAARHGFDWWRVWYNTNRHWDKSYYYEDSADAKRTPKGYNATLMTEQALDFVRRNTGEQPWCLFVSLNPPHSNFLDAPDEQKQLYDAEARPWRPNVPEERRQNDRMRRVAQGYSGHISAVDRELGRLLDALDETGQARNTIVAYSSDHGEMLGSQNRTGKRLPWEESCRIPFVARWPAGMPAGREVQTLFGAIDTMPSLVGLAGLAVPGTCDGLDLSAAFRGEAAREPESQFIMHIDKHHASGGIKHPAPVFRGVRTDRYTYARWRDGPWLLYDNQEDPFQQSNLIDDPKRKKLASELEGVVRDWLKAADDPGDLRLADA
ncbi:MAG: sulfatase [Armatimonadota bacterium]|jgi:arylsulfatase A-like enzyme